MLVLAFTGVLRMLSRTRDVSEKPALLSTWVFEALTLIRIKKRSAITTKAA